MNQEAPGKEGGPTVTVLHWCDTMAVSKGWKSTSTRPEGTSTLFWDRPRRAEHSLEIIKFTGKLTQRIFSQKLTRP